MASYASGTEVPVSRSIDELDRTVTRFGATGFAYARDDAHDPPTARVMFRIADRMVRFDVPTPQVREFLYTPTNQRRTQAQAERFAAAEERRRWRQLLLLVKALLVAVQEDVVSLADAFLPYTLLPSGQTFAQWAGPQLDTIAATAQMPAILPGAGPQTIALPGRVD